MAITVNQKPVCSSALPRDVSKQGRGRAGGAGGYRRRDQSHSATPPLPSWCLGFRHHGQTRELHKVETHSNCWERCSRDQAPPCPTDTWILWSFRSRSAPQFSASREHEFVAVATLPCRENPGSLHPELPCHLLYELRLNVDKACSDFPHGSAKLISTASNWIFCSFSTPGPNATMNLTLLALVSCFKSYRECHNEANVVALVSCFQ
jgi:hypothetical protein